MSQGSEVKLIYAGAEVATAPDVYTALQAANVSPAHKHILATRALVEAAKEGKFPVSLEIRGYFGVVARSVLSLYGRLLASELITFHELAAAAGNGAMLTHTIRRLVIDAPEIITCYDIGQHKRAEAYKRSWEKWDDAPSSVIPGIGKRLPGGTLTELAKERAHESKARVCEYLRLHPMGDPDYYNKWEKMQWKIAEMKILSP